MSVPLPRELNLASNKPVAASARPAIQRYRSDNSSYTNNDTIRIEIPTNKQGAYLFPQDSFIEGKVKVNTTGGTGGAQNCLIDGNVYSLFNRMRIIHGGTTQEDTLYVNRLWNVLYDIQVNESERRGDAITKLVYDNGSNTSGNIFNNGMFGAVLVSAQAASAAAADSNLYEFNFVLPSALLGSLASKAVPLSLMGASSLYIELELASPNQAFVLQKGASTTSAYGTINSFTVQDIYYNAKITNLPMEVEQAILETTGGVVNLPAVAYKTELKTINSSVTAFNDKFSFQYSSVKNFLFWIQNQTTANGAKDTRAITSRPRGNISDYYLTINGEAFPSQAITGGTRQYSELMRSFDMLTDTNAGGILTNSNYSLANNLSVTGDDIVKADTTTWQSDTVQKRWVGGIDLDRFNRSSDILMSGTNTLGQMLSLIINFSSSTTDASTLFGACMYDVLYHIEGGQLSYKV